MIDMIVKKYHLNNPSGTAIGICDILCKRLAETNGILSDNECKNVIKRTLNQTEKLNYSVTDLRIDAYRDHVGVVSAMGTTANISRRILSAIHYHNIEMIGEIIFICQSPVNAWYQHNHNKSKPQSANGNRATSKALIDLVDYLGKTIQFPIIVIELTDDEDAMTVFTQKITGSKNYLNNDYKIDWDEL